MREILFRGKKYNGEWFYGNASFCGLNNEVAYIERIHTCSCQVIPETVGQYTGLTDKNGKKIFEGDICDLCILGNDHVFTKITIQHGCVGFEPLDYDSVHESDRKWRSFWKSDEEEMWNTDYFTVVGNIHDNPELLGGDNQ